MQNIGRSLVWLVAGMLALPAGVLAQEPFGEPEPQAGPAPETSPAPEEQPEEQALPAPEEPPAYEAAPAETEAEADHEVEVPAAAKPEEEKEKAWYDNIGFRMFVDAYYMKDWLFPSGSQDIEGLVPHRAFAHTNGFALSFVGLDLDYQTDDFGATVNLRWGSSVPRLIIGAPDRVTIGLDNLKQGYLTWKPTEKLALDFGQFDTIYGAEVSESFENINYTRGALYFLMQPFYHTGLRVSGQVTDKIGLTGLLVNATNDHIDSDPYPDVGIQASIAPTDDTSVVVGYLASFTKNDVGDLNHQHFFDVVATAGFGDLSLVFNGDVGITKPNGVDPLLWWGVSLAAGYAVTDWFDVGVRGEFLQDPDGFFYGYPDGLDLVTGTLTLGFKPIPGHDNLLIRLDNRIEWSSEDIFPENGSSTDPMAPPTESSGLWGSTVLGVVVKTN